MRTRRVLLVTSILAVTAACGLTAIGEMNEPTRDAGTEAGPPFLPPDGSFVDRDDPGDGGADASFDAQGRCLEVCDGGTCDAGTCSFECALAAACATRVVCPPGVPCDVKCTGAAACAQGVDCVDASACNVECTGSGACLNQNVACGGSTCNVTCNGSQTCSQGIACDAGTCNLRCSGDTSCQNQPVACNANVCNVQCGADAGGGAGKDSCSRSVICNALTACNVVCASGNTCKNALLQATAPAVDVKCLDTNACQPGVAVAGKDAGVVCRKNGACGDTIYCDAGKCAATCVAPENPSAELCCAAGSTCVLDASACNPGNFKIGCP